MDEIARQLPALPTVEESLNSVNTWTAIAISNTASSIEDARVQLSALADDTRKYVLHCSSRSYSPI